MFLATDWKLEEPMNDGIAKEELVLSYVKPKSAGQSSPFKR
jgi:hypothetical protein